ncbi:MAG: hypothetical protein ACYS5V_15865, partial [Planctomycetota bacterium]
REYARDALQELRLSVRRHELTARDLKKKAKDLIDRLESGPSRIAALKEKIGKSAAKEQKDRLGKELAEVEAEIATIPSELHTVAAEGIRRLREAAEARNRIFPLKVEDAAWSHLERALHRREYPSTERLNHPGERARLEGILGKLNEKVDQFKAEDLEGEKGINKDIAFFGGQAKGLDAGPVAFDAERHKVSTDVLIGKVVDKYRICLEAVRAQTGKRLEEVNRRIACTRAGMALDKAIGKDRNLIILHLAMNLGDVSDRWTFIHGQDSQGVHASKDDLGKYAKMFQAIVDMGKSGDGEPHLETRALEDPFSNRIFAPGKVAHSGAVAGTFGVANLAAMTPMDRHARDGQPCDVVGTAAKPVLGVGNMVAALKRLGPFLGRMADAESMSLKKQINPTAEFVEVDFSLAGGRAKYKGPSVLMMSSGSVMPDRPARGAIVAVMKKGGKLWEGHKTEKFPPGFRPYSMTCVEVNGRFELAPYSRDYVGNMVVVSALHDDRGLISFVTNTRTVNKAQPLTNYGGNIFPCRSGTVVGLGFDRLSFNTQALKASSTAPLNEDRSLVVEGGNTLTVYVKRGTDKVKLFNPEGMVVLGNAPPADPVVGEGVPVEPFEHYPSVDRTAADLLTLNDGRLGILRGNRIVEDSIERLHLEAQDLREKVDKLDGGSVSSHVGMAAGAAAYSRRAYGPLPGVLKTPAGGHAAHLPPDRVVRAVLPDHLRRAVHGQPGVSDRGHAHSDLPGLRYHPAQRGRDRHHDAQAGDRGPPASGAGHDGAFLGRVPAEHDDGGGAHGHFDHAPPADPDPADRRDRRAADVHDPDLRLVRVGLGQPPDVQRAAVGPAQADDPPPALDADQPRNLPHPGRLPQRPGRGRAALLGGPDRQRG